MSATTPTEIRVYMSDGTTIQAPLLDPSKAMAFWNVQSSDGLTALYDLGTYSGTEVKVGVDYPIAGAVSTLGINGHSYVWAEGVYYNRPPPTVQTNLAWIVSQGPQLPLPPATDLVTPIYVVGDGSGKVVFQTSDKAFAAAYINLKGGSMIQGVGIWPNVPAYTAGMGGT